MVEPPRVCSYLPEQTASLEYLRVPGMSPEDLQQRLQRGWRRFGIDLFRPVCRACMQCVPVRVDVATFQPTKSQRRTQRRNSHVSVELAPAGLSRQHVELYNAWHEDMKNRRDWPEQVASWQLYAQSFLAGDFPSAHELRYWNGNDLIGVGLIDILPTALSSIYFYHAPNWRSQGPGTFSLLCEIELARKLGLAHVYLGYWIAACPSMAYKNRFRPYDVLQGRPEDEEEPVWLPGETSSSTPDDSEP
ncbi:MAG TPA: arginyltransferase [Planctomicrobium sp.]|nr:arginyltransferase [Planctomicrobium sp.]